MDSQRKQSWQEDSSQEEAITALKSMYDLSSKLTQRMVAMSFPHTRAACHLIDIAFYKIVESQAASGTPLLAAGIQMLGQFVEMALRKAFENGKGANYLNLAASVLGYGKEPFPKEFPYEQTLPVMWMMIPRLVEMRIEAQSQPESATLGHV